VGGPAASAAPLARQSPSGPPTSPGYLTKVTIDVSWVTNQLDAYDQDDQVCLDVRSGADGLQAIGVSTTCGVDPHHRSRVEDDPPPPPPPLAPTATPTKTNTPVIVTSTPTLTPTSTVTLTPTATNTSTPIPVADLSLTKTGDLFCNDGCFPDFVITVTNSGPNPATNVTVKDYPENFVIVSAIPSRGTYNMITNVWDIGPLGVGETVDISIFGTFMGPIAINTAEVLTSNPADPDSRPGNLGPGKAPVEDDEGQAIVPGLS
jgi:uncharacterized repeat protein (TIGR01451 family)